MKLYHSVTTAVIIHETKFPTLDQCQGAKYTESARVPELSKYSVTRPIVSSPCDGVRLIRWRLDLSACSTPELAAAMCETIAPQHPGY